MRAHRNCQDTTATQGSMGTPHVGQTLGVSPAGHWQDGGRVYLVSLSIGGVGLFKPPTQHLARETKRPANSCTATAPKAHCAQGAPYNTSLHDTPRLPLFSAIGHRC